jgi:hypothetical protein
MKNTDTKTMKDSTGAEVPTKYVNGYDKERDKRARRILARTLKARAMLETFVVDCLGDIDAIRDARLEEIGKGDAAKGNFTCQSFDGLIEIQINQQWSIRLDERVKQARDAMLAYAKSLFAKAGSDAAVLFEIVEEAFAVGRTGNLSVGSVMRLCRRDIKAPEWVAACKMLLDSIQTDKGKAYLKVSVRPDTQHDFRAIRLDIADCWPIAQE